MDKPTPRSLCCSSIIRKRWSYLAGLPRVLEKRIARELARQIGAGYVRIDSIEQAIRASAIASPSLDDVGYRAAHGVAERNLRIDRVVRADPVNSLQSTRDVWLSVAKRVEGETIEIEVTCSDLDQHRRRLETGVTDIPGLIVPAWADVIPKQYHPGHREHFQVDSLVRATEQNVGLIREARSESWRAHALVQ
jgi:predicted kinase